MHSIQKFARATGFIYFLLIPIGPFGIMYITSLNISGDVAATIGNLLENETLARWSIAAAIVTQLLHFFLVLMLYKLLKPAHQVGAKIMVILVMVGMPIAMLNEFTHGAVLWLIQRDTPATELVALFLEMHVYGINIVQIFWGLWLFPMGYAVYKSEFLPKFIGIILMIGCFGYFIDSFTFIIDPTIEFKLSIFLFWGEILITFWLLIKGVNVDKWHEKNEQSQL